MTHVAGGVPVEQQAVELIMETCENHARTRGAALSVALELEFPVVSTKEGLWGQMGDAAPIIAGLDGPQFAVEQMAQENGFSVPTAVYRMERGQSWEISQDAGVGTLELATPPFARLADLQQEAESMMERVVAVASARSLAVLGYGCHPMTSFRQGRWVRKDRYDQLRRFYGASSHLNWMTTSAALQCQVDARNPEELRKLVVMFNSLSPFLQALMVNSPISGGVIHGAQGRREMAYRDCFPRHRCGIAFEKEDTWPSSVEALIGSILDLPYIWDPAFVGTFREMLERWSELDEDRLWLHEGSWWPVARPRFRQATCEVRFPCQQLPGQQWAVAALMLGLAEQLEEAGELANTFSPRMAAAYRGQALVGGLHWEDPMRLKLVGSEILSMARNGLQARGWGEESYLDPLWQRLDWLRSPADEVLDAYIAGGMEHVLDLVTWK